MFAIPLISSLAIRSLSYCSTGDCSLFLRVLQFHPRFDLSNKSLSCIHKEVPSPVPEKMYSMFLCMTGIHSFLKSSFVLYPSKVTSAQALNIVENSLDSIISHLLNCTNCTSLRIPGMSKTPFVINLFNCFKDASSSCLLIITSSINSFGLMMINLVWNQGKQFLGKPLRQILIPSSTPLQVSWCITRARVKKARCVFTLLGTMQRIIEWGSVVLRVVKAVPADFWADETVLKLSSFPFLPFSFLFLPPQAVR